MDHVVLLHIWMWRILNCNIYIFSVRLFKLLLAPGYCQFTLLSHIATFLRWQWKFLKLLVQTSHHAQYIIKAIFHSFKQIANVLVHSCNWYIQMSAVSYNHLPTCCSKLYYCILVLCWIVVPPQKVSTLVHCTSH